MIPMLMAWTSLTHAAPEPVVGPSADAETVAAINAKWRGLGLGYSNGLWGSSFAQGIRADVPFGPRLGQFLGIRARGLMIHDLGGGSPFFAGGAELFGRGPVALGLMRAYGGGGVHVGAVPTDEVSLGFGGHVGIEGLLTERTSISFEVGGQGGAPLYSGASVMGGLTVYLGDL